MSSLVLAVIAGFLFCLSSIYMRKAMYRSGESFTAISISSYLAIPLFGLAILGTGEIRQLAEISWRSLIFLMLAGFVHFVLGRILSWSGSRLIGANLTNPIINAQGLFSIILGVTVLNETLTVYLVVAFVLILGGIVLISMTGQGVIGGEKLTRATLTKGVLITVAGSVCFGISPMLIKLGLGDGLSATPGIFISYTVSAIIYGLSTILPSNYDKLKKLDRKTVTIILFAAAILCVAQLMRYMAFDSGSISLVTPIFSSISALVVFPLSFLINRKIEIFNTPVIIGAVLTTVGVFLIFLMS